MRKILTGTVRTAETCPVEKIMRLQGTIVSDRKFRDIAGRVIGSHHNLSIRRDIARVFSVSQLIANQLHRTSLSVE